jgi:hypothetical protein
MTNEIVAHTANRFSGLPEGPLDPLPTTQVAPTISRQ